MQTTINNRKQVPLWPIGYLSAAIFVVLTLYNAVQHGWLWRWLASAAIVAVIAVVVMIIMLAYATYLDYLDELDDDYS